MFMKHKIVFFDMDGTLYQTENDVIQESALDAIQTLKDKGNLYYNAFNLIIMY